MKKIYITLLMTIPLLILSQRQNDNWYFGSQGAVNFYNQTPVGISTSSMYALEACGAVSDDGGNLLFYMNGEKIWNRDNQVMPNGTLLAPYQNDSAQQLAIVKNPANSMQYYVFITGESNGMSNKISYSIVDMSLGAIGYNGAPLGDVVQGAKTIPVLSNTGQTFTSEAITVVPNVLDESFWVLIPNGTKLYSYKVSHQGISNGNPVVSDLNFPVNLGSSKYYSIKPSAKIPNNYNHSYSHYICVSYFNDTATPNPTFTNKVYSFNSSTGMITPDYSLQIDGIRGYVPEFNKNASVLFLGHRNIHAIDLVNSTPSNVQHMEIYHPAVDPQFEELGIQRNKYGDIYISRSNNIYLGKILNPDVYGPSMGVNMSAVPLAAGGTRYGLPQPVESQYDVTPYSPCMDQLTLSTPEIHDNLFTYNVAKEIKTIGNYQVTADQGIIMNSGNNITLLPNTLIRAYRYIAKITTCDPNAVSRSSGNIAKANAPVSMFLNLDKGERSNQNTEVRIFPNPVKDMLNISASGKIKEVEIYDISGKRINAEIRNNQVDVKNIPAGSYVIRIVTDTGVANKQFIKR
ncbi:T9SS type A sorting domain-containing protein [Chryseobacterium sp.]|uniref:T9SS type A sorting domain-containing protein n=1 Tax=Chryseobacterium sp. TaxID=1871047 RepID=UPI0025C0963E|nr:T9SS type A sorting domain-containing protein [Chryseobacterium sp.]MBV8328379.1 T9SS type A sorting domain-containing protein [Chryseobacterium sp.]